MPFAAFIVFVGIALYAQKKAYIDISINFQYENISFALQTSYITIM